MHSMNADRWIGGLLLLGLLAVLGATCDARAEGGDRPGPNVGRWEECSDGAYWMAYRAEGKTLGWFNVDTHQVYVNDPATGQRVRCEERAWSQADARERIELAHAPGLNVQALRRMPAGYYLNGKLCTEAEAMRALKPQPKLADDSALLSLTVIGPAEACKAVETDVETHPAMAAVRGDFVFQSYRPDDWAVQRSGFVLGGKPTIYCQAPDGTVLFRDDKYEGPELLAAAVEKSYDQCCPKRDPVPDYQPEKDRPARVVVKPQLEMPWGWIAGGVCTFAVLAIMGVGMLSVVFYLTRRPPAPAAVVVQAAAPPPAAPPAG